MIDGMPRPRPPHLVRETTRHAWRAARILGGFQWGRIDRQHYPTSRGASALRKRCCRIRLLWMAQEAEAAGVSLSQIRTRML